MTRVDRFGQPVVPCETCNRDTTMLGTRLCDACWEVERRLDDYLSRSDKAREYVRARLANADQNATDAEEEMR